MRSQWARHSKEDLLIQFLFLNSGSQQFDLSSKLLKKRCGFSFKLSGLCCEEEKKKWVSSLTWLGWPRSAALGRLERRWINRDIVDKNDKQENKTVLADFGSRTGRFDRFGVSWKVCGSNKWLGSLIKEIPPIDRSALRALWFNRKKQDFAEWSIWWLLKLFLTKTSIYC